MQIYNPSATSPRHSISGDATETEIPVDFEGHAENWEVDYGDWWTVLIDHKGNRYDDRTVSLNQLKILTAPGEHTWYWKMYEKNNPNPVKTTNRTFNVKHSIQVLNIFDLSYGGSKINIDGYERTSGQYAYKYIDDNLLVGGINQEFQNKIYIWKDIPGNKSDWKRSRKNITLYTLQSFD